MKISSILILLLIAFVSESRSQEKSCCTVENNVSFTAFAGQKEFRDVHQLPAYYRHENPRGKPVEFNTIDGTDGRGYFIESERPTDKYIFVLHEWWGLNDYIMKESDELKDQLGDVNILALDLYDGKIAENREDAAKYMQSVKQERAMNILKGAIEFAGNEAKIGTIGWCFGGGWSLQASIILGNQGKACVMYYGIIENTPDTFSNLNAPVLGIFAERDGWVNPTVYGNLEKNLKAAGREITVKSFDADHAFANPSNSKFDQEATRKAKELTIEFFKEKLLR